MKGNVNRGRIQGIVIMKPHMDDRGAVCFELKNIEQESGYSGTKINENIFAIKIFDNEQKRMALSSIDVGDRIVIQYKLGSRVYRNGDNTNYFTYLRVIGFDIKERRAEKVVENISPQPQTVLPRRVSKSEKKPSDSVKLNNELGDIPF
ncbi:MAG: hypothetical protein COV57_03115 [Candidatus Liptonbacteria bacterium CG11_big_fil_rev_8_21_14_0_20_35_14]|uniref:Single-stranded DNA-binding protein n=1 Tax=Candidatus Liptonbacteria bacterium CG11_big_fil_rev_8_21_14_0_20_35_14 TaxID=1974634 RepID=A0A2H0N9A0_9BACT|nr:MAG: hypothetical protein COV57_03115 [Candidatus Liptonbacteria bacterium CG11_big_fil_rev_8_21_14_0_20_35_14]PJB52568.1 MAG: hypothetical protein CO099_11940 [Bdellovibrio sp. CG_4_9_14_3_um_filter_39_7]